MADFPPALSILIPTRNDEDIIGDVIDKVIEAAKTLSCPFEVIVIDVNSTDGTREILAKKEVLLLCLPERRPYGEILREGFRHARGQFIITLDGDLLPNYDLLARFWKQRKSSEFLIGSRYVKGGSARMPLPRKAFSRLLNRFYSLFLSLPFADLSSGFRMYNTKIFEDVQLDARDYSILMESILKAYANGWRISEIPFRYEPVRFANSTKRAFSFLFTYLRSLFRMWQLRNGVFSADYDERAFNSLIPLQRYWQRTRYRIIMSFVEEHSSILDIGCGSSRIIQQLQNAVGLDIALKKLRYLQGRGIPLARADINALPFKDNSFSLIICSQVIEHVPEKPEIYTEFHRVLQEGGFLILGTPDYGRLSWRMLEYFYKKILPGAYAEQHITHYTAFSLEKILLSHGFDIVTQAYVGKSELIVKAVKVRREHHE